MISRLGVGPLVAVAVLSLGCAVLPETGAIPRGEPLYVDMRADQTEYVVSKDASGNMVRQAVFREGHLVTWGGFQGCDKLDDEDFFRMSGDVKAADQVAARRARAVTLNRVGWALLGVGAGLAVTGIAVSAKLRSAEEATPVDQVPSSAGNSADLAATVLVATVGITMMLVGSVLTPVGNAAARREHPLDDLQRAERDARIYNEKHGIKPETIADVKRQCRAGEDK